VNRFGDGRVDAPGEEPAQPVLGQVWVAAEADLDNKVSAVLAWRSMRSGSGRSGPRPGFGSTWWRSSWATSVPEPAAGSARWPILRVDLPAATLAQVPGDAAVDLGQRVPGSFTRWKWSTTTVPLGSRSAVRIAQAYAGGRVDRYVLDGLPERGAALGQPRDDRGAGAALPLPEQALLAVQVDEPRVPGVDPHPPLLLVAVLRRSFPRRVSSMPSTRVGSGSVSCSSVGDDGGVRGRLGHAVAGGDLAHRAGRIPDPPADLGAQPPRGPRTCRHLRDRFGERGSLTVILSASQRVLFHRKMVRS